VYVVDRDHQRVLKETPADGSYTLGIVVDGDLNEPRGAAVDGSGNIYVADTKNHRVLKETAADGSYTQRTVGTGWSYPWA
jgi:DNA-binding beta-propeller fold protein YncE